MSAYVPLPWLRGADAMRAIGAGISARRRGGFSRGGGRNLGRTQFGPISGGEAGVDPRLAAQAEKIRAGTKLAEDQSAQQRSAWELHNSLLSRGATPQEAYEQSGLAQFGVNPDANQGADKIFEVGNQVVKINPLSGASSVLFNAPPKVAPEHRYSGPSGVDIFGKQTGSMSLTLPEWAQMAPNLPDQIRTNAPVSMYADWGRTNASPFQAPTAPVASTNTPAPFRVPMGGYGNMEGGSQADFMAPATEAVQEVIRKTKDGRRAVYDANTKQFIRYAD